jgi:hypothetical protein
MLRVPETPVCLSDVEEAAMTTPTITDWIDRWENTQLVSTDLAEVLRSDAATAEPDLLIEDESTVDRVLSAARSGIGEALGYLGAAVTVGALSVLFDVRSWDDLALAVLMTVVALVTAVGVFLLTPATSAVTRRLAGVLGLTSVTATATTLTQVLPERCWNNCTLWQEHGWPAVVAVGTTVVAAVLYARHRHLLTHIGLGGGVAASAFAVGALAAGPRADWTTIESWQGILLFVVAVAWVVASERGILTPAWLGTLVAGGVSYAGLIMAANAWGMFLFATREQRMAALLVLGLGAAYTAAGVVTSRLRPTIVGAGGLLFGLPWTFTEVFGWSATQTAGLLLPVGIVLTVWAIVANRDGGNPVPLR